MKKLIVYLTISLSLFPFSFLAMGQERTEPIVIPPLFEYPTVPDTISSWTNRSNWLVTHFWDNFDFKQKAVAQVALNHAFKTYLVPLQYANINIAEKSLNELIKRISKNPGLLIQFTKAANYNCYDPATADVIIDSVYLAFVQALVKNKKVPKILKTRYESQLVTLSNSLVGKNLYQFPYTDLSGEIRRFESDGCPSVIFFADPTCVQCQDARIKLSNDARVKQLVEEGKVKIYYIVINPDDLSRTWQSFVTGYPEKWIKGASADCDEIIDLRTTPSIYLLDNSGVILQKSDAITSILSGLESMFESKQEESVKELK